MPSTVSERPHVLILGAGLGGLTLAQSLRKQGVSFEIFEKDQGLHSRFQGWAIALHVILQDLKQSVPDDLGPIEVTSHLSPLDIPAQFSMHGQDGSRYDVTSSENYHLIRANRSKLRDWLAANIDVQWNRTVTKIEENESGVTLHFADGQFATGDVLVGCDGVHSLVRGHLFPHRTLLQTVPIGQIIGQVTLNKEQYERQLALGHSAYVALCPGSRIFCGLNSVSSDTATARYYWLVVWRDPVAAGEPYWTVNASKQKMYDAALEKMKSLDPKFTEIIRLTKVEDIMAPPIVLRDMALESIPEGRATLVGDAAHPMTPYRGEGGNHALQDALNLARAIAKSDVHNLSDHIREYQDEMLARSRIAVKKSREAAEDDDGSGTRLGWGQGDRNSAAAKADN